MEWELEFHAPVKYIWFFWGKKPYCYLLKKKKRFLYFSEIIHHLSIRYSLKVALNLHSCFPYIPLSSKIFQMVFLSLFLWYTIENRDSQCFVLIMGNLLEIKSQVLQSYLLFFTLPRCLYESFSRIHHLKCSKDHMLPLFPGSMSLTMNDFQRIFSIVSAQSSNEIF